MRARAAVTINCEFSLPRLTVVRVYVYVHVCVCVCVCVCVMQREVTGTRCTGSDSISTQNHLLLWPGLWHLDAIARSPLAIALASGQTESFASLMGTK